MCNNCKDNHSEHQKNHMMEISQEMFNRSGKIRSNDPVLALLVTLMTDEIIPGRMEIFIEDMEDKWDGECTFANGWLAQYAQDLVNRLNKLKKIRPKRKKTKEV